MAKAKPQFYAVRKGRETGVFTSWAKVQPLVNKFPGAVFKGFATRGEAEVWSHTGVGAAGAITSSPSSSQSPRLDRSPRKPTPSSSPTKLRPTGVRYDDPPSPTPAGPSTNGNLKMTAPTPPAQKEPFCPTESEMDMALSMYHLIQEDPWIKVEVEARMVGSGMAYEIHFGENKSQNVVRPVVAQEGEDAEALKTRTELKAVYECCKLIHGRNDGLKYDIQTTSEFVIKCYYRKCFKWQINGWVGTNNCPVPYRELIEPTMTLLQQLKGRIRFGKLKYV